MIIRRARVEDVPHIADLWEQMVHEMRPEWTPDKELWAQMAHALFESNLTSYTILVAEKEEKIIGFIDGMVFKEPSTGKVHGVGQHFYVSPDFRDSLLAAMLYREMIGEAIARNVDVIEFFCFPEGQSFWEKRGYRLTRCMMRANVNV